MYDIFIVHIYLQEYFRGAIITFSGYRMQILTLNKKKTILKNCALNFDLWLPALAWRDEPLTVARLLLWVSANLFCSAV